MRVLRLLFICMVLVVQLFSSIIVTLSSEQILQALHSPQTLTGLISGSLSVILMVILMAGLFLPQFDRMSRYIRLMDAAQDIVNKIHNNEAPDQRDLDSYHQLMNSPHGSLDSNTPTLPTTRRTAIVRRQLPSPEDEWPYGR